MRVIWVLENIRKDESFYTQLNIALLLASAFSWKKHSPGDWRVFYCDKITRDFMISRGIPNPFDEIIELCTEDQFQIDTTVFWSSSKLRVLALQTEPVLIVDHDFISYEPLLSYIDLTKPCVCNVENAQGYYPGVMDPYVKQLSWKVRWMVESVNVGFLYLPDPEFTRFYAGTSLQIMEEFTKLQVPHSKYLIFAEQLVLRQLFHIRKLEFQSLISEPYQCLSREWKGNYERGFWTYKESQKYFEHYGPGKRFIKDGRGKRPYSEEVRRLLYAAGCRELSLDTLPK